MSESRLYARAAARTLRSLATRTCSNMSNSELVRCVRSLLLTATFKSRTSSSKRLIPSLLSSSRANICTCTGKTEIITSIDWKPMCYEMQEFGVWSNVHGGKLSSNLFSCTRVFSCLKAVKFYRKLNENYSLFCKHNCHIFIGK